MNLSTIRILPAFLVCSAIAHGEPIRFVGETDFFGSVSVRDTPSQQLGGTLVHAYVDVTVDVSVPSITVNEISSSFHTDDLFSNNPDVQLVLSMDQEPNDPISPQIRPSVSGTVWRFDSPTIVAGDMLLSGVYSTFGFERTAFQDVRVEAESVDVSRQFDFGNFPQSLSYVRSFVGEVDVTPPIDLFGDFSIRSLFFGHSPLDMILLPVAAGDVNVDGVVNEADFQFWQENNFQQAVDGLAADFNGDGLTDGSDFNLWLSNRTDETASSIPEPSTAILAICALAAVTCLRRRRLGT